jgi:ParB family chromosome partitioning protein
MARRSGLGKGLSALIPSEATGETDSALRVVPISHIKPNAFQPRSHFDEESMSSLAASIREVGLLQPVLVREVDGEEESYELIAGERRWRAARRAGLQTIPVLVQPDTGDVSSLEQALVENLHREDLNALEEAAAYQQLIDEFGLTHEQVATRMGKGRATVTNTLRLLQLPAGAQRALAERTISAGHARALLGTPDRTLQDKLVEQITSEGLTVRAVEEIVRAGAPVREFAPIAPEELPAEFEEVIGTTKSTTTDSAARRPGEETAGAGRSRARGPTLDLFEHQGEGRYPESSGPIGRGIRHTGRPGAHLQGDGW